MPFLLPHLVTRAAERAPESEAASFGDASLTWAGLAGASDRLAGVLREAGVRRGDRVAILSRKGLISPTAIHGIMRAGAAYVPLDPFAPAARQALILEDCGIRHLVGDRQAAPMLRGLTASGTKLEGIVGVDAGTVPGVATVSWDEVDGAPALASDPGTIELDLAYVLYTSGSTGVPKGVTHTHRSALSFAEVAARTYGFRADDRMSNHAPLHFDLSTMDYFSAAVAGATTVVIPEVHTRLPASLSQLMEDQRLTVLYVVPLVLTHLLLHGALDQRDLSSLRWVLFGGEPFSPRHLRELMAALPTARFSNVYGPTEVNGVTYWNVPSPPPASDEPLPIGGPFANVQMRIVDANDDAVGEGEVGELWVRTPSMMAGYWGRPDLDEGAFARVDVGQGTVDHVYHRTGDLVRLRVDGVLDFIGRKDRQIKTRGYRVELDEVEAAFASHGAVAAAASFGISASDGSQRIHAAVTLREEGLVDEKTLMGHAASMLPRYALPERLSILDVFPRTSSGKIDRLALRDRAMSSPSLSDRT
jgi:amino acid adenylation domain-containing protein